MPDGSEGSTLVEPHLLPSDAHTKVRPKSVQINENRLVLHLFVEVQKHPRSRGPVANLQRLQKVPVAANVSPASRIARSACSKPFVFLVCRRILTSANTQKIAPPQYVLPKYGSGPVPDLLFAANPAACPEPSRPTFSWGLGTRRESLRSAQRM